MSEREIQAWFDTLAMLDALIYQDGYVDAVFCDGTWEELT